MIERSPDLTFSSNLRDLILIRLCRGLLLKVTELFLFDMHIFNKEIHVYRLLFRHLHLSNVTSSFIIKQFHFDLKNFIHIYGAILIRDCILFFTCIASMSSDVGHLNQRLYFVVDMYSSYGF